MNNVKCSGSEENLDECEFQWSTDCSQSHDALVECYNISTPTQTPKPDVTQISQLRDELHVKMQNLTRYIQGMSISPSK